MAIRDVKQTDWEPIRDLIAACYKPYGERICLDGADNDLLDLLGAYARKGGAFAVWEIEDAADTVGPIHGTHAVLPLRPEEHVCVFRRLYLDPALRGRGLGDELMQWAVDWAKDNGYKKVEFWSDTRFHRAHSFFRRFGFQSNGETREMTDSFEPYQEYFFWLDL